MRQPPTPTIQNVLVSRPVTTTDSNSVMPTNNNNNNLHSFASTSVSNNVNLNSNTIIHPTTTVARRDDLLAAAVLAAEDTHDTRHNKRSVIARVTRRWAKFSDSLWGRRRPNTKSSQQFNNNNVNHHHQKRDRQQQQQNLPSLPPPPLSQPTISSLSKSSQHERIENPIQPPSTTLAKETQLREQLEEEEEFAVSSLRETSMRRVVRQVGATDDDDTLLVLPRVTSQSFSNNPTTSDQLQHTNTWDLNNNISSTPQRQSQQLSPRPSSSKIRPLPRVLALMPTRPPGAPPSYSPATVSSPVSSSSRPSSSTTSSSRSSKSSNRQKQSNSKQINSNIIIGWGTKYGDQLNPSNSSNRKFQRLPTGLLKKDVEKEVEDAVIEISSEDESDPISASEALPIVMDENIQPEQIITFAEDSGEEDEDTKKLINKPTTPIDSHLSSDSKWKYGIMRVRSKSEVNTNSIRLDEDIIHAQQNFQQARRNSSNVQYGTTTQENERKFTMSNIERPAARSQDIALFEDDYLSFQGFHGNGRENRNPYQSMSSLLRSKRISSVTDSPSEDSDEYLIWSTSCVNENRRKLNNASVSGGPKSWLRRNSLLDKMVG